MVDSSTSELTSVERLALAMARLANESALPKRVQHEYLLRVTKTWIRPVIASRVYLDGADWLVHGRPDIGVVLSANHRSFFDMYVLMLSLFEHGARWIERIFFPVRANFFYEHPLGMAINMLIGGGVMYPPLFRDASRSDLNRDALERMSRFLSQPGTVVGVHPEGTRGKGPDPYQLLRAQPGVGQIVLQAQPLVVPVFINGLPNDVRSAVADTFRRDARRDHPVIICVGQPLDYSEFSNKKPRAALYKRCADKMLAASGDLSVRERQIRQACARGEIDNDDPGWLIRGR
ncbi:lysophospholipid acyltransferase family protein [Haliangium sp.]|uniref:lysophospholipid acyltransferase family protein n=1 Tax=Haliangium sp. TaxID=2663208 RepID=UPI003D118FDC